jgi:CTP:molybdopterin cytidylyltransferase MocA
MTTLCGIVLAAGEGRRMGAPKALLELGGTSLAEQHVSRLVEAGCSKVVVVVRPDQADEVRRLLDKYPEVEIEAATTNAQSASLAAGLRRTHHGVIIITPVDLLPARLATYQRLLGSLKPETLAVTPVHAGRGGHPVIVRRALLGSFAEAPRPLREVLAEAGTARLRVEVDDPNVLGDFDTPADLPAIPAESAKFG